MSKDTSSSWSKNKKYGLTYKEIAIICSLLAAGIGVALFLLIRLRKRKAAALEKESYDLSHGLKAGRLASEKKNAQKWLKLMKISAFVPLLWPIALIILPFWCKAKDKLEDVEEQQNHLYKQASKSGDASQKHFQSLPLASHEAGSGTSEGASQRSRPGKNSRRPKARKRVKPKPLSRKRSASSSASR